MKSEVALQLRQGHPPEVRDFVRVWCHRRTFPAEVHMDDFVFDQAVWQGGAIAGAKGEPHGGFRAQFLGESAPGGRQGPFARPGMTAAGIRPQTAGVILGLAAALEQQPAVIVDEEDGECAMQQTGGMYGRLAGPAHGPVAGVHEYQVFRHRVGGAEAGSGESAAWSPRRTDGCAVALRRR